MAKKRNKSKPKKKTNSMILPVVGIVAIVIVLAVIGSNIGPSGTEPSTTSTSTSTQTTQQTNEQTETLPETTATVSIVNSPNVVDRDAVAFFIWSVDDVETKNIQHTALHWGMTSVPDARSPAEYPEVSKVQTGDIPKTFRDSIKFGDTGVVYIRAHAIVDGVDVFSEETSLFVIEPGARSTTLEFTVRAKADGFELNGNDLKSITPRLGETVRIKFIVDPDTASPLTFRSEEFGIETDPVLPDGDVEVEFKAFSSGEIVSYNSEAGNKVASIKIATK